MLESFLSYFVSILKAWNCEMVEFNGESDHVHLLVSIKPDKRISDLVGNLKSSSCKNLWRDYPELSETYRGKKVLWTPSYFVSSCGGVTVEQLKKYVQDGTF
jgi:putative transposase